MHEQDMALVPGKAHYSFDYISGGRVFSYAHQIDAICRLGAQSVLEIGPGPGMVTAALRAVGIAVTTVDVQAELKPDIIASVLELPVNDNAFDATLCCQVLEHLPFDTLESALRMLYRKSRLGVVVSLPDARPHYHITVRLPFVRSVSLCMTRPYRPSPELMAHRFQRDGHYWEIGYPGITLKRLLATFAAIDTSPLVHKRVRELAYHHFFIWRKSRGDSSHTPGGGDQ